MDKTKYCKTNSFIKELFICTPKEIKIILWVLLGAVFAAGGLAYKFSSVIPKVEKNSVDIGTLKTEFTSVKSDITNIKENGKNTNNMVQDIWKHLLHKK